MDHDSLVDSTGWVKNDVRRGGFGIGIARHHLKHPIDHADMEVHMLIQAGAEPVDESHCADMQGCLIRGPRVTALLRYASCNAFVAWLVKHNCTRMQPSRICPHRPAQTAKSPNR